MPDTDSECPWDVPLWEFDLTKARVVATLGHDRGAIVENLAKLTCWEGRLYTFESGEDGPLNLLEYRFGFSAEQEADPMASTSTMGRIVITGTHPNGLQIEIRGDGWIGYDDKGNLEGTFDDPPVIIAEDHDPEYSPREREYEFPDFPMPPQYNRARLRASQTRRIWTDDDI